MVQHIVIADDHTMIRKGMKLLLATRLGCKYISEADSCNALMNELKRGPCTHIILDVILSDGTALEVAPVIRKLYPAIKIMIFSMQLGEEYADAFKQYDIHYYLSKSSNEEDTVKYITRFLGDEASPHHEKKSTNGNNPFSLLAPRELEILHYLLNGYQTKNIAKTLNLSDSTVSTLKKRIFEKTGSSSLAQLFELASVNNMGFYTGGAKNNE